MLMILNAVAMNLRLIIENFMKVCLHSPTAIVTAYINYT